MKPFRIPMKYKGADVQLTVTEVKSKNEIYFEVIATPALLSPFTLKYNEASGNFCIQEQDVPGEVIALEDDISDELFEHGADY